MDTTTCTELFASSKATNASAKKSTSSDDQFRNKHAVKTGDVNVRKVVAFDSTCKDRSSAGKAKLQAAPLMNITFPSTYLKDPPVTIAKMERNIKFQSTPLNVIKARTKPRHKTPKAFKLTCSCVSAPDTTHEKAIKAVKKAQLQDSQWEAHNNAVDYILYIEDKFNLECYHCAVKAEDVQHLAILNADCRCSASDFIREDESHFKKFLKTVVFQSSDEVRLENQEIVDHNEQPNVIAPVEAVVKTNLISIPPTIDNIFTRSYLLNKPLVWTTSQAVGTMLGYIDCPADLVAADLPIKGIMDYHGVLRANVEIQIIINANPFICGQIALCAVPYNFITEKYPLGQMTNSLELYPHSYLNAGYETNAKVVVPYVSTRYGFFNLDTTVKKQGTQFQVFVWNALKVATGQPVSYNLNVYFRFIDVEVGIKMPRTANKTVYQASEASGLSNIVKTVGSGIANSGIPIISQIAKVVGGVTGMYDAPIAPITVANTNMTVDVPKVCADFRVLKGDFSTPTTYENVNLKKYIQTYGRVYVDSWSTTDSTGTQLLSMSTTYNQRSSSSPDAGGYQVPVLEVGRHFAYWRGSIKFKFQIVATRFHQGQILVSWTPFGSCNTINEARAAYYMSLDIGQSNSFEVEIPFIYPVDYCPVGQQSHGTVQVWVQNPLIAPQNVATDVAINVYMAAGEDFEFSVYQNPNFAVYQAGASAVGEGIVEVWRPLGTQVARKGRMEGHDHLEHFLRRPGRTVTAEVNYDTVANSWHRLASLPYLSNLDRDDYPAQAYFASGGVRWSVTTNLAINARFEVIGVVSYNTVDRAVVVYSTPIPVTIDPYHMRSGMLFHHLQSPGERVMRYEIPMYIPAEYECLFGDDDLYGTPTLNLYFRAQEILKFNLSVYWEAADDFRLSWPLTGPVRSIPAEDSTHAQIKNDANKAIEHHVPTPEPVLPTIGPVTGYDYPAVAHLSNNVGPHTEFIYYNDGSFKVVYNEHIKMKGKILAGKYRVNTHKVRVDEMRVFNLDGSHKDVPWELHTAVNTQSKYDVALSNAFKSVRDFTSNEHTETAKAVVSDVEIIHEGGVVKRVSLTESIVISTPNIQPKDAQYQGLEFFTDRFKELKDILFNLKKRLEGGWQNVRDAFYAAKEAVSFISEAKIWGDVIRDALTFLATHLLPAISAIYTAWHSTGVVKMLALTQLTAMAFNISCPEERKEGVEYESNHFKVCIEDGREVIYSVKDGRKIAVSQGIVEDLASVSEVVSSVSKNFCKSVLTYLGCWVSADYETYLRRMTLGIEVDTWEYCVKVFGHSVLYFIHGKSLNVEWERQKKVPISEAIQNFNLDNVNGLFEGANLYQKRNNKTNLQILEEYFKVTQSIYSLSSEMNVPASMSRTIDEIKATYRNAMRQDRRDISQAEPVGIFVCGQPGCGKSFFSSALLPSLTVAHTDLPFSNGLVFPYPMKEGQKFWDGYAQQPFILHDEFLQQRDSKEAIEVLGNISCSRPVINMASLEDKGTAFNSPFYVCTSNEENFQNVNSILKTDALARRFPFALKMRAKKAFMPDGKPSVSLMRKHVEMLDEKADDYVEKLTELVDKIWHFERALVPMSGVISSVDGKIAESSVEAKDFIKEIAQCYAERKENYEAFKKVGNRIADNVTNQRARKQGSDDDSDYGECDDNSSILTSTNNAPSVGKFLDAADKRMEEKREQAKIDTIKTDLDLIYRDFTTEDSKDPDVLNDYRRQYNTIFSIHATDFGDTLESKLAYIDYLYRNEPTFPRHIKDLYSHPAIVQKAWPGLIKTFALLGAGAAGIAAIIYSISSVVKSLLPRLQSYTGDSALGFLKAPRKATSLLKSVALNAGGSYHDHHLLVHNNMAVIEVSRGCDPLVKKISALWLDDTTLLVNTHLLQSYFEWVKAGDPVAAVITWKHRRGHESYPIRIEAGLTRRIQCNGIEGDLTVVRAPTPARGVKNIWHLVARKGDFANLGKREVYVKGGPCTVNDSEDIRGHISAFTKFNGAEGTFLEVYSDERTIGGDCGRPYLMTCVSFGRPLVGIHACISSNSLGAVPVIYEDLIVAVKTLKPTTHIEPADDIFEFQEADDKYWNSEIPLYFAKCNGVPLTHHSSKQTSLKPLQYQGIRVKHPDWDCDYQPAALRANGVTHPLITNAQKYEPNAMYAVDTKSHATILDFFSNKFNKRDSYKRVYTVDEAINGTITMNPLKYNTGCGYLASYGFSDGKKDFFDVLPQEYDVNGEALPLRRIFSDKARNYKIPIWDQSFVDRLDYCRSGIENGKMFTTFWISTNKDELRPLAKVVDCKTRVFEQPGLEFTLLVRQYFGGFLDYFKERGGFTFYHGIGCEKEAVWKVYRQVLIGNARRGHAFDYKNWDGTVSQDAYQFFEDVCARFYEDSGSKAFKARKCLLRILRDSHHVMGRYYFQSSKGNKSGNPFTDVFNSVCNFYVMALSYLKCRQIAGLAPNLDTFDDEVKMLTYGDDVVMTVKNVALEYFRGSLIAEILRLYGYTVTDSLKSGVVPDSVDFDDLTFLKSPFVEVDGVCLAPLPKKDIYKELCYAPKQFATDESDVQQRVANVLGFMAHHGEVELSLLKRQLISRGIPRKWMSLTYDTFVEQIRDKQATACID